jgi:metal-responsive CopG/Arc/MetJ family transcriptional regulator
VSKVTKLSVSVPTRVWEDVERLLGKPGETRSALVARVLKHAATAARDAEIAAEYERAYREMPESPEERAAHAGMLETTRRRFSELDRQESTDGLPRAPSSQS